MWFVAHKITLSIGQEKMQIETLVSKCIITTLTIFILEMPLWWEIEDKSSQKLGTFQKQLNCLPWIITKSISFFSNLLPAAKQIMH